MEGGSYKLQDAKHVASRLNRLKDEIKDAMDSEVQVFPDNYKVFS
jgi:hypothetical protein